MFIPAMKSCFLTVKICIPIWLYLSMVSSSGHGSSLGSHRSIGLHEFGESLGRSLSKGFMWHCQNNSKTSKKLVSTVILQWWWSREEIRKHLILLAIHVKHCLRAVTWRNESHLQFSHEQSFILKLLSAVKWSSDNEPFQPSQSTFQGIFLALQCQRLTVHLS